MNEVSNLKIWKYDLERPEFEGPIMEILDVQFQNGLPVMWAIVNPAGRLKKVETRLIWTGQSFDSEMMKEFNYIKTLQDDLGMVWHVFLKVE